MGLTLPPAVGKVLYGVLFNAALPAALVLWAWGVAPNVGLPAVASRPVGVALLGAGLGLAAASALTLMVLGRGLPMNPYPPQAFVTRGPYWLLAHPIYAGAVVACVGASLAVPSAAGLWLVSPVVALGAAALVLGYERQDLEARFGPRAVAPVLGLPLASPEAPRLLERVGALVTALAFPALAALALHGAGLSGRPSLAAVTLTSAPEIFLLRLAPLLAFAAATLRATRREALRERVVTSALGSVLVGLAFVGGPGGPYGGRLALSADAVLGVLVALFALPSPPREAHGRRAAWAVGVALLALAVQTSPDEVLLGGVAFVAAKNWRPLWLLLRRLAEAIANSWREVRVGPVRVINHGTIGAVTCGVGVAYLGVLAGPAHQVAVFGASLACIVGSALWAQAVEGSLPMSRPYGFFGGLLGVVVFAVLVAPALGTPAWHLLGAFCTAGPVIQGLARLRCLANGCCHGAPCDASVGIVYTNPRTRVLRLAKLGGQPIHPTQLYSLLSNAVIAVVQARLWAEGAPLALVGGLYLVLMGLARFVEEAWRGEPQTPVYAGLRLYQWVALFCVVVGAGLTTLRETGTAVAPEASLSAAWMALAFTAVVWLVASVDFPESTKRFARLA